MKHIATTRALFGALALSGYLAATPANAIELNEYLSFNGVAAGVGQCFDFDTDPTDVGNECEGALVAQPEASVKFTPVDEFFIKIGMADGNGLNDISPFALAPWAADLEDDLTDINGRSRDNILTLWYKHTIEFTGETTLALTGGIIDSTDYLDDVGPANDEFTQFLNEAFVNAPVLNLQSYDYGGAAEFDSGPFSARFVYMSVGENDDGMSFNFYGGQLAVTVDNGIGEGTYRVVITGTSSDFLNPDGTSYESLFSVVLGADQQIGEYLTLFGRFGWQDDDAAVDFDAMYSGGVAISGALWYRDDDTFGIGYTYFEGGNGDIQHTNAFEAYYRVVLPPLKPELGDLALTLDAQYMEDKMMLAADTPEAWLFGLRLAQEW